VSALLAGSDLFSAPASPKPLREHQLRAIGMLRQSLRSGKRHVVVAMPTGAGKTRTAAEIVNGALAKGNRVAFTVPAISLIDQTVAMFESEGIHAIGVMQSNHLRTDRSQPVQVVSVQTLSRRQRPNADVIVIDECHVQFSAVRAWLKDEPRKVFIGLSATPWARGMAEDWEELLVPVRMQELIDRGFLSPFRVFAPSHPDLTGVKIRNGDYAEDGAAEVMGGLVADVVSTWREKAFGLPTLVFAVNRAHAASLVEQFASAGIRMGYCDANVDLVERKFLFGKMARGELSGIVNVGTLTTGVDADVRCVVLARPTRSEMLFVQMIGRGLRTALGKEHCLILDHADNHARLGFVTDIHHDRLKDGKGERDKTRKERGEPMPKECPSCGLLKPAKVRACPKCGFEPVRQSEVEVEDGELIEVTRHSKAVKLTGQAKQRFYSELVSIAQQRGRSRGWIANTYRERTGVWPKGLFEQPIAPSPATIAYVRAKDIRFAKSRGKR